MDGTYLLLRHQPNALRSLHFTGRFSARASVNTEGLEQHLPHGISCQHWLDFLGKELGIHTC
jgi:hypothetical protein